MHTDLEAMIDAVIVKYGSQHYGPIDLSDLPVAQRLLKLSRPQSAQLAVATVERLAHYNRRSDRMWEVLDDDGNVPEEFKGNNHPGLRERYLAPLLAALFRRTLPFTATNWATMFEAMNSLRHVSSNAFPVNAITKNLQKFAETTSLDATMRDAIRTFAASVEAGHSRKKTLPPLLLKLAGPGVSSAAEPASVARPVQRGYLGELTILSQLKRIGGLLPAGRPSAGEFEEVGNDRFPLHTTSPLASQHELLSQLYAEWHTFPHYGNRLLDKSSVGQRILALPPDQKGLVLLALSERYAHATFTPVRGDDQDHQLARSYPSRIFQFLFDEKWELPRPLLFELVLATAMVREPFKAERSLAALNRLLDTIGQYAAESRLSEPERYVLSLLRVAMLEGRLLGSDEQALERLAGLIGDGVTVIFSPSADWVDILHERTALPDHEARTRWIELLRHCATAQGTRPSAKWRTAAKSLIDQLGLAGIRSLLVEVFDAFASERADSVWAATLSERGRQAAMMPHRNVNGMKGLLWLAPAIHDKRLIQAIHAVAMSAYRSVPGIGPRAVTVGNASVQALGQIGSAAARKRLQNLMNSLSFGTAKREIVKALKDA